MIFSVTQRAIASGDPANANSNNGFTVTPGLFINFGHVD
ncbi:hypothetical protein Agau_C100250 [Agrobacterium tumefaciens F2]|nr:hypothetical protein Agau_C100250 [Agrobacterium tumefaciens F2]